GVTIRFAAAAIPFFTGVQAMAAANRSGGLASNRAHFSTRVRLATPEAEGLADLLFDPQTSGGLLVSVGADNVLAAAAALEAAGVPAVRIGTVAGPSEVAVEVR